MAYMKFIGITGGVGAGKSTVLSLLKDNYNCKILLADEVAAELMTPGHDCFDKVVALPWPESILSCEGIIDRPKMAKFLYASDSLRESVNGIVHPAVWDEVQNQVEMARKEHKIEYFFFEAALLIECGYGKICDEMWYIYTDLSVRRSRLKESRGYSDERIDAMLFSQLSDEIFREQTDYTIDNSGKSEETFSQIKDILQN